MAVAKRASLGNITGGIAPQNDLMSVYGKALDTNMDDYNNIMGGLKSQYGQAKNLSGYTPSADVTSSVQNLGELSRTGGYDAQAIADLRARGISPIRAIYANANRDINRKASLAGSSAANLGALKARMAREQSAGISDQVSNINAQIAQNVAQNRLQASPAYASAAGAVDDRSIDWDKFRYSLPNDILSRMTSLYGTTPGLSNMLGDQAYRFKALGNDQETQQLAILARMLGGG